MFKGDVLTPSGWTAPRVGEVIACMGGNGRMDWQEIKEVKKADSDFLQVENNYICYAITLDHEIAHWRDSAMGNNIRTVSGSELLALWQQSPSKQVKVHHITNAYPDCLCHKQSAIKEFALSHFGKKAIPEKALSIFRRYLDYRLVYPQAYIVSEPSNSPFAMCQSEATQLLAFLFPFMRNYEYTKKAKSLAPVRTYKTPASQLLQAACFFAGITSVVKDDIVKLYLHGSRGKYPIRPTITPATKVTLYHEKGWHVDVKHPLVRLNQKIVVL